MNFDHCVVVFDNGRTLSGIITGTFNEGGCGIYVQAPNTEPVPVRFSEITSLTVTA